MCRHFNAFLIFFFFLLSYHRINKVLSHHFFFLTLYNSSRLRSKTQDNTMKTKTNRNKRSQTHHRTNNPNKQNQTNRKQKMEDWGTEDWGKREQELLFFPVVLSNSRTGGASFLEFLFLMRNTKLSWNLVLKANPIQIKFPSVLALTAFVFTCQIARGFKGCWLPPVNRSLQACDFKHFQVVFLRSA